MILINSREKLTSIWLLRSVTIASYEPFCWDAHFTVPTFDFFFKVALPKANKERIIVERNKLGQVVKSIVSVYN
jgi:type II restriction/modification system DNA methylase subunit YeeA